MTDETPLGAVAEYAIEVTDRLAVEFPDGFEVGEIIIVMETRAPGEDWKVQCLSSDNRPYIAHAILAVAAQSALAMSGSEQNPDPD